MTKLRMRADVRPQSFIVIREGEYMPIEKVDLEIGEQVYFYRGPGYKVELCSMGMVR